MKERERGGWKLVWMCEGRFVCSCGLRLEMAHGEGCVVGSWVGGEGGKGTLDTELRYGCYYLWRGRCRSSGDCFQGGREGEGVRWVRSTVHCTWIGYLFEGRFTGAVFCMYRSEERRVGKECPV